MSAACHLCGAASVAEAADFRDLHRVTSDCQPWPAGGVIGTCMECGAVQKIVDAAWRDEIQRIYGAYAIYHQGGGAEQAVFDQSGASESRSARLVGRLSGAVEVPVSGRLLDIGCGNGAFLRAFAARHPSWRLTGTELGDRNRASVESIAQVERFHAGDFAELDGTFDMISLLHVLEHIEGPVPFLKRLAARLAPGGHLFIEVPFFHDNPFDLLIADHATHFTPAVLENVLRAGGFAVVAMATDWVTKEISVVARPAPVAMPGAVKPHGEMRRLAACIAWLRAIAADARQSAGEGPLGIFGTSIAGVWLYSEVGEGVAFFVDEDAARIGTTLFGRPVVHPDARPAATTFVPLAPAVAAAVTRRLGGRVRGPRPL
jgi:SAM-dependent methyltransferase